MASFVGYAGQAVSAGSNYTITPHASTQTGDVLIVCVCPDQGTSIGAPGPEWTAVSSYVSNGNERFRAFAKARAGGDTSYTFTNSHSSWGMVGCMTFRGYNVPAAGSAQTTSGTAHSAPAVGSGDAVACWFNINPYNTGDITLSADAPLTQAGTGDETLTQLRITGAYTLSPTLPFTGSATAGRSEAGVAFAVGLTVPAPAIPTVNLAFRVGGRGAA